MLLKTVFVRFYKSFNYDYLRKNSDNPNPSPWDRLAEAFYPYVVVPIDKYVTTVVGANESGKSHLLSAIECGVTGKDIQTSDFCRCSQLFGVVEGNFRKPDFGTEWLELTEVDRKIIREACGGLASTRSFDRFLLFRTHEDGTILYLPTETEYTAHKLAHEQVKQLAAILPRPFRIDSKIALPASVAIRDLAPEVFGVPSDGELLTRERRFSLFGLGRFFTSNYDSLNTPESITKAAPTIHQEFSKLTAFTKKGGKQNEAEILHQKAEVALARDLVRKVAKIDPQALKELYEALREGREGHVSGLINKINDALSARLNFPRFWAQDRAFALVVSPREYDLVFTIRDRTGTEYSFTERSSGLRFFLSYYIQYLAHEATGPDTEILLMDEPDAYLSSQAQQDLLKVFQGFAAPEGSRRRVQVTYVTHSPFLIDKNYADRIRVLEKGVGDEGTRVVRDVSRNHYEPLRSAFGAFVGETAFIGNCNLMVEGTADQILIAGIATLLRAQRVPESETLDLNRITVVPTGGAQQVPYLVYLARGRDVERPAVVVLLDSDKAGDEARAALRKGAPRGKRILDDKLVLQIGELKGSEVSLASGVNCAVLEIEDLVPLPLCVAALRNYATEFWNGDTKVFDSVSPQTLAAAMGNSVSTFGAIESLIRNVDSTLHVNKIAFARSVLACLASVSVDALPKTELVVAVQTLLVNFRSLFRALNDLIRKAEKERSTERVTQKIDRVIRSFFLDYQEATTRERAGIMLREIEDSLDESVESDQIRSFLPSITRDFHLVEDIVKAVDDFGGFKERMEKIRYAAKIVTQEAADGVRI